MNRLKSHIILLCFHVLTALAVWSQNIPEPLVPKQIVNDFVKLLDPKEKASLEQKLRAYNDSSSTQIAVVIINSTDGYAISQYATELGEQWGVGQKGLDNGVVVLTAIEDREVFIATGYGVEDVLPDIYCKRIVENVILPAYKEMRFFDGLDKATDMIIGFTQGRYTAEDIPAGQEPIPIWLIILIILLVLTIISATAKHDNSGSTISGRGTTHRGGWGYTGGGFGGGGSSGGGFGGFGGGSFGGGGAGGRW